MTVYYCVVFSKVNVTGVGLSEERCEQQETPAV